jgi:crotonobetainyl-CoA:carnitine CoA-transferase CaiB-like acyl-CoA transferase
MAAGACLPGPALPPEDVPSPLDGVHVLEVANWVAAPSAAALLADLGARVIKVEPPGGDAMRYMARQPDVTSARAAVNYAFEQDNRGKESIGLDLELPEFCEDEQARPIGIFASVQHPVAGRFDTVAAPFRLAGVRVRGPAPEYGAHTWAVLGEIGLPEEEVVRLAEAGAFG